jgi:proteasome lid subunit RPN8/RPN11
MAVDPLSLPADILAAMLAHALREFPNECCGLLGGDGRRAVSIYPLRNIAEDPARRYDAEPRDLIQVDRDLRALDQHVVAIYHSHPCAAPVPSRTDLERNYYGDMPHIIISLQGPEPELRAWRLDTDTYEELPWRVAPAPT